MADPFPYYDEIQGIIAQVLPLASVREHIMPLLFPDPVDQTFLETFYSRGEEGTVGDMIQRLGMRMCRDIFHIRRRRSGKIFFQCACCQHAPISTHAKYSIVTPERISGIYSAMTRFMTHHVHSCEHIPTEFKAGFPQRMLKTGRRKKAKGYWINMALKKGLRDGPDNSIVYAAPTVTV